MSETKEPREGIRCVKLLVTVPLPVVVTLTGTVPQQGDASLTSVEG
jgi:hypothetical protein